MILVRFPFWVIRVPWHWIFCMAPVLVFLLWWWFKWEGVCDDLLRNAARLEAISLFKVYPR